MYNKRNSNLILKDNRFSPAQRIALREIVQLSDRTEGCTAKNATLANDLSIGVSTVKTIIKIANQLDIIFVFSDNNNRKITLPKPSWKQPENNHLVAEIQPLSSQESNTKQPENNHLVAEIQPSIYGGIRTEQEENKNSKGDEDQILKGDIINGNIDQMGFLGKVKYYFIKNYPKYPAEDKNAKSLKYKLVEILKNQKRAKGQPNYRVSDSEAFAEFERMMKNLPDWAKKDGRGSLRYMDEQFARVYEQTINNEKTDQGETPLVFSTKGIRF